MAVDTSVWPTEARLATADQASTVWEELAGSAIKGWTAIEQAKVSTDLNRLNLDRARLSLPPIDTAAYQQGMAVSLSPADRQLAQMAIYGLLGLGVLWLVFKR
jgi:hypothetical protein